MSERLCIKYKIMAVQPLNKTKIIKKKTNKIRRFQSDEFKRVKVRNQLSLVRVTSWVPAARVGSNSVDQDETFLALIHSSMLTCRVYFPEILEKAKRCRLLREKTLQRQGQRAQDRQQAGQEDQILAQIWLQEAPHQKRKRHRTASDEQPRLRRRDCPVPLCQDQVSSVGDHLVTFFLSSHFTLLSRLLNCAEKPSWPVPRNSTWDWRTLRASLRRSPPSEQAGRTRTPRGDPKASCRHKPLFYKWQFGTSHPSFLFSLSMRLYL